MPDLCGISRVIGALGSRSALMTPTSGTTVKSVVHSTLQLTASHLVMRDRTV